MSYPELVSELRQARELVSALVDGLDDRTSRTQFHPDLSPIGWHLGHCTFVESDWLQATIGGDNRYTHPVQALYTPSATPKAERGGKLPALDALLAWTSALQAINDDLLEAAAPRLREHALMQDNYLLHFLIQHYSQHYESLLMILTQRACQADDGTFQVDVPLAADMPQPAAVAVQPGHYRVGGTAPLAYDNELPPQQVTLGPFRIATRPVSNSAYLAFIEDGGYRRAELWSSFGWNWRELHDHEHPDHWRRDLAGNWYGIAARGAYALAGDVPVSGLSFFEAEACARWAGGRLPHEHQWEVACRLQLLEDTGRTWEWCGNSFYPYAGYRAFPYDEYSQPWFDDSHYSLRGGSLHTRPAIRRASFRNFYQPDKRHIFAGLRPVYDTAA
ncbi:MAG: SUMF1/EgtB/PvdO family nonheme iron enzyme [Gammaproteobacteria bacterium]